ncbi:hypothetical protein PV327_002730 [Microctonus hyperodae]|uniref:Uncharacterized protein n=1 Tax=Microctonus hyperodae TaxID=165561 RepID=A0AA39FG61_MICHY|nr:hypothetical protein PV327_002730 [Microctonus hyperodae]
MQTMRIGAILAIAAILFAVQVCCRPDKLADKNSDYPDDTPQDYDDDEEVDNESDKPSGPPEILSKPMVIDVRPGDNVELPCHTVNAEDLVLVWKKDGVPLYFGGTLMEKSLEKKIKKKPDHSLVIYNITKNDASDNYTCSILSGDRTIQVIHRIHVVNKPNETAANDHPIRVIPGKRVEVNENESVTIGCETKHPSKTEIKWSHKGERLHNGEIVKEHGNYITIKHATRHHSGRYQCLAEDGSEKPAHEAIEVVVKYSPVIEVDHEVVHTGMEQTTQLTCKVFAHPRAKVSWFKDQKEIKNKKDKRILHEDKAMRTLTIEHTTKHDLGTYTCVATNQLGEVSKEIIVTATPAKPKFIGGEIADDETTIILKWHVESFSPILEYKLEYRQKGDTEWKSVMPNVQNGDGTLFTVEHALENLQPGMSYEAKLAAKNDFGWSPLSASHKFDKEYVADEPQNVKGKEKIPSDATMNRGLAMLLAPTLLVLFSHVYTCL